VKASREWGRLLEKQALAGIALLRVSFQNSFRLSQEQIREFELISEFLD
jgi:hypothetical protein